MNRPVIETVTFRLAAGVTDEAFLKSAEPIDLFLARCEGFVARRLSRGEDGLWLDHLEWTGMAEATAAAKRVTEEPSCQAFMAAIDPASIDMRHDRLVLASPART